MPLYEVRCTECGNVEEQIFSYYEDPFPCEKCGSIMEIVITGTRTFEFKGEGTHDKGVTRHGED